MVMVCLLVHPFIGRPFIRRNIADVVVKNWKKWPNLLQFCWQNGSAVDINRWTAVIYSVAACDRFSDFWYEVKTSDTPRRAVV